MSLTPLAVACTAFGFTFGAALIGMLLHGKVPSHHVDGDSRDVMKLVMGLVATMAALVLGLLIASAKTSYDTQTTAVQQISAYVIELDRQLEHYGPETKVTRDLLRQLTAATTERIWTERAPITLDPSTAKGQSDRFYDTLQNLTPHTDAERIIQNRAMQLVSLLIQTRLLMYVQLGSTLTWPFLGALVFWISILFLGFGLFTRLNATVVAALFIGALSVSAALFLLEELSHPYSGLLRVSEAPLRYALSQIGR
jgi:hypothetical protein